MDAKCCTMVMQEHDRVLMVSIISHFTSQRSAFGQATPNVLTGVNISRRQLYHRINQIPILSEINSNKMPCIYFKCVGDTKMYFLKTCSYNLVILWKIYNAFISFFQLQICSKSALMWTVILFSHFTSIFFKIIKYYNRMTISHCLCAHPTNSNNIKYNFSFGFLYFL